MVEYDVVYDTNFDKFRTEVNRRLADGWELQGGAQHSSPQGLFVQAMSKKEPEASNERTPAGAKPVRKKRAAKKTVSGRDFS